jgi:hypothetical protein
MKKVVINACFGGFSLSPAALLWLYERGAGVARPIDEYFPPVKPGEVKYSRNDKEGALKRWRDHKASDPDARASLFLTVFSPDEQFVLTGDRDIARDDPLLVECVETLGDKANGGCAALRIVEVPEDAHWHIDEYDGNEHVAEDHRTWG